MLSVFMTTRIAWRFVLSLCLLAGVHAATIDEKTAGMRKMAGYFPLYWDEKKGSLYIGVDKLGTEILYVNSLPAGLGSNDIGLDRGQLGDGRIVRFERSGPKVLLIEPNYRYRAITPEPAERRAVEQSFAQSVLWGFEVQAEDTGRVLLDATAFFLRDAHGVGATLQRAKQGTYHVDASRCAIYLPATKNFPNNTEVEATITLTGEPQGRFIAEVTPSPDAVTVRQHHSFVALPGPGYEPRTFDPRAGFFGIEFADYAAPLGEPIQKRFINRHRLPKNGTLTYYLDRGAPEPIRSALLEGARWWSQAFAAAGFPNAWRVELMPEDADPMDTRYNVIQWVHRATRGWSYGAAISDPRTGEIIKGQVTLGSLRVRQDWLIAEGLLAPYEEGKPRNPQLEAMALARLRQLAAHEVGHTLGLAHNFAASVKARASVMDYPHPLIGLSPSGAPDLSNAYATGIGEWDKIAIRWGYGNDDTVLRDSIRQGYTFISDQDARPEGGAHPAAHLWDNGTDAVAELLRILDVRRAALARFGADNIPMGRSWNTLEDALVPVYLLHRYQIEAAAKVLGGLNYTYALRGDGETVVAPVPEDWQERALDALLATISSSTLTLPPRILSLLPPPAFGFDRTREDFEGHTGLTFDPMGPVEAAANLTVGLILNPERAARLAEKPAGTLNLAAVIRRLVRATWEKGAASDLTERTVDSVVVYHLVALASNAGAPDQVRAIALQELGVLRSMLEASPGRTTDWDALASYTAARIKAFENNPKEVDLPKPVEPPPGQPIGCDWN
jgi:hypothetical protein